MGEVIPRAPLSVESPQDPGSKPHGLFRLSPDPTTLLNISKVRGSPKHRRFLKEFHSVASKSPKYLPIKINKTLLRTKFKSSNMLQEFSHLAKLLLVQKES